MKFKWSDETSADELDFHEGLISEIKSKEAVIKCVSYYAAHSPECPSPKSEDLNGLKNRTFNQFIYLDNNATHPILDSVKADMLRMIDIIGNPSSKHAAGEKVRAYIESARIDINTTLGRGPYSETGSTILFTASGSESNNTFIKGVAFKNLNSERNEIITTKYEHKAVLNVVDYLEKFGFVAKYLDILPDGTINTDQLMSWVGPKTLLVSIIGANNELGVILPINEYARSIKKVDENILFHSDMSQLLAKTPKVSTKYLDAATFTVHKFGGPAGISVLYLKNVDVFDPLIHGGNQELKKRAGTYNAPQIVAAGRAFKELKNIDYDAIKEVRDYLESALRDNFDCFINCLDGDRLVNTTSVVFKDIVGDELILFLSNKGIFISASSACTSHEQNPSHVLKALGLTDQQAYNTVRITLNRFNTKKEIDILMCEIKNFLK